MKQKRECQRCGTCCRKGGPALHKEDRELIENGTISLSHLVTVRQGEPAFNPFKEQVEPARHEFIKIGGKKGSWECLFFDGVKSACTIHQNRPLECRLLECWDTDAVGEITGRDCLCRFDIMPDNVHMKDFIVRHEETCSMSRVCSLLDELLADETQQEIHERLTGIMQKDLQIRSSAVARFHLSLEEELFYFGRPLFHALHHPRLHIDFKGGTIRLSILPDATKGSCSR
ncbi:MAG: YkgJ family cysteine cluster protein [Pseudomonadota bacterium]